MAPSRFTPSELFAHAESPRRRAGGRPPVPPGDRRAVRVELALSLGEFARARTAADAAALPLAVYARERLLRDRPPARAVHADLRELWRASATLQSNANQLVARLNELRDAGELAPAAAEAALVALAEVAPQLLEHVLALRRELLDAR